MERINRKSEKITKTIGEDILEIVPLGGGSEVGRSCIMNEVTKLDCGIHPASNDISALPFFDLIDPAEIDLLLVTHFHLDHCGAVPYITEKTTFKAPVYMTYPTKAIYKHVLSDSIKVFDGDKSLFESQDIENSLDKISVVNFHQEVEVSGIRFTCYAAGHVLGACMFLIDIAGTKILYTGDYSREEDRHIKGAEIPNTKVDVLIVESTYGVKNHDPRDFRERTFLDIVRGIVKRNGHCLLPVFALGRAQEILLILEEYWDRDPEMESIPIYYASTLMAKCRIIFQTYVNMMGDAMKESFKHGHNAFNFKNISILKNIDNLDNNQPSVVMASPGMLQKGLSRTLFEKWCSCSQNGVVFTGYCVESTLAREVLNRPKFYRKSDGTEVPINMSVHYVSFSAHADYNQTQEFIKLVDPTTVILVHGESHEAERMKKALENTFPNKMITVPKNWQVVEIPIKSKTLCKVEGRLITHLEERLQEIIAEKMKQNEEAFRENKDRYRRDKDKSKSRRRKKSYDRKDSYDRSRSRGATPGKSREKIIDEKSEDEYKSHTDATKSHIHHDSDDNIDPDLYVDVPFDAFLIKKNFDYILVDKEDITDYTGKTETKITQALKVPYKGTLQLVSHFISQMYPDSKLDTSGDDDKVIINGEISILKDDLNDCLQFKWLASKKNDIIADCLAYFFSEFPNNEEFDMFNLDAPKTTKDKNIDAICKKVIKRLLNVFSECTYRQDRHHLTFRDKTCEFHINLKKGIVDSKDEEVKKRVIGIIGNLFNNGENL